MIWRRTARSSPFLTALAFMMPLTGFSLFGIVPAFAYVGPSFLYIESIPGGWLGETYKDWIRAEANYWTERPPLPIIRRNSPLVFSGDPNTPKEGPNQLTVAIDKQSPALKALMNACVNKTSIPELIFAESSDRGRHTQEVGPRPDSIPEYFEYKLLDVRLDCPVADGAPEQAFAVHFAGIEWLNYIYHDEPQELSAQPAELEPGQKSGTSRSFVVTWFAPANDVSKEQCPVRNTKPGEADYYALMSKEQEAATRAALESKGGVDQYELPYRGPDGLNACLLPGIVPDPGHATPQTKIARGFNLDGADGTPEHPDYVSVDGEMGIDNQLYTVEGCVVGFQRRGIFPSVFNEGRRNGDVSILVDISGIDDERNDESVDVTILYSEDHMAKDGAGKIILPDYTFRVSDKVEFSQYFRRLHGRMVDGVITTDPVEELIIHQGRTFGIPFDQARLRLEILPDGSLKALLGGYIDWREYMTSSTRRTSTWETGGGFQAPGLYNAVRRAADGLKDPVTGAFNGISVAYDIEGVPAFIPPQQRKGLSVQAAALDQ